MLPGQMLPDSVLPADQLLHAAACLLSVDVLCSGSDVWLRTCHVMLCPGACML